MTEQQSHDHVCPKCKNELKKIWSSKKQRNYWSCQGATEECGAFFADESGKPKFPAKKSAPLDDCPCPACAAPMQKVESTAGTFYSCSTYPECKYTIDTAPDGALAPLCPSDEDHGHMKLRSGRNGSFFSCRGWKEHGCDATRELDGKPSKKKVST